VDGVGTLSESGFGSVKRDVEKLADKSNRTTRDVLAQLQQLSSKLEDTGRRVDSAKKPGEAAVELLQHVAKVKTGEICAQKQEGRAILRFFTISGFIFYKLGERDTSIVHSGPW
jgi:hypothetical protein